MIGFKERAQFIKNRLKNGKYSPDICHENAFKDHLLHYRDFESKEAFTEAVRQKFLSVLGDMPPETEPTVREEYRKDKGKYTEIRLLIETEKDCVCPCFLLLPKGVEKPPVVICLQGHSNGMMISLGEGYCAKDRRKIAGDRDFGLQVIDHGYAAMLVEQRGFGERRSKMHIKGGVVCDHLAHNALLLGRTLIGERLWDVKQVINVLETRDDVDANRLGIMGNSGGGTASYYAACFDERIKIAMPSCALCTYKDSIGAMKHCACNYLPSAAKYFDMGELSCLIYPRPLVIVSGRWDPIFPLEGAKNVVSVMKEIYADKPENLSHFIGNGKHRFYADAWELFDGYMKKL